MHKKAMEAAHRHLKKDPRMRKVLKLKLEPRSRPTEPFQSLVRSIIYQQISGKAAAAITKKFLALFPGGKFPTPAQVLKVTDAQFKKAGVSPQKRSYLRDLALRFTDGTIEPHKFSKMTDEEIREHLIRVKGIGRWTADMFLMFTLYRPDVLPTGDLAIQKGFQRVFNLRKLPDVKKMEKLAKAWSPHRTVASLYLWRVMDGDEGGW
ncbi:MAG TPA: DNA-3-methyladenine glycosylase [Candidatus Paceibacterota bacterium]|nr:DNA-3-methyladenine glycosylase [Candidatus Paceibacterota bacterium]